MILTQQPQAISGVSPGHEAVIEELYPSIAATAIGDFLARLLNCIPTRIWGMRISNLLFGLLVAPLAVVVYLWMKVFGHRYVVTNRAVKIVNSMGFRLHQSVDLSQISSVDVDPDSLMVFYQTGDVRLIGSAGQTLMLLRGVPRPERFCQVIHEACSSKSQVASAMARIAARH
jgi:hypothetical protein